MNNLPPRPDDQEMDLAADLCREEAAEVWHVDDDGITIRDENGLTIASVDHQVAAKMVMHHNTHDELVAALQEASGSCACSVRERESGHLLECGVPRWCAVLAKVQA